MGVIFWLLYKFPISRFYLWRKNTKAGIRYMNADIKSDRNILLNILNKSSNEDWWNDESEANLIFRSFKDSKGKWAKDGALYLTLLQHGWRGTPWRAVEAIAKADPLWKRTPEYKSFVDTILRKKHTPDWRSSAHSFLAASLDREVLCNWAKSKDEDVSTLALEVLLENQTRLMWKDEEVRQLLSAFEKDKANAEATAEREAKEAALPRFQKQFPEVWVTQYFNLLYSFSKSGVISDTAKSCPFFKENVCMAGTPDINTPNSTTPQKCSLHFMAKQLDECNVWRIYYS